MKTFHFPKGHEQFKTLTVAELRAELSKWPDEMPVLAEWEGQRVGIQWLEEGLYPDGKEDKVRVLVLDANDY